VPTRVRLSEEEEDVEKTKSSERNTQQKSSSSFPVVFLFQTRFLSLHLSLI